MSVSAPVDGIENAFRGSPGIFARAMHWTARGRSVAAGELVAPPAATTSPATPSIPRETTSAPDTSGRMGTFDRPSGHYREGEVAHATPT